MISSLVETRHVGGLWIWKGIHPWWHSIRVDVSEHFVRYLTVKLKYSVFDNFWEVQFLEFNVAKAKVPEWCSYHCSHCPVSPGLGCRVYGSGVLGSRFWIYG